MSEGSLQRDPRGPVDGVLRLLLWATVAAAAVGYLGRQWWLFDLFSHFRVQYLVLLILLGAGAAWRGFVAEAVAAGVFAVACAAAVVPTGLSPAAAAAAPSRPGAALRVLSLNVELENDDHAAVAALIAETDADIVALLEVDRGWLDALAPTLASYPERLESPATDRFGIAVYARHPMTSRKVDVFGEALVQSAVVKVEVAGRMLTFVAVHAVPPVGAGPTRARNELLRELIARRPAFGAPLLICGDFNLSPWSPYFADFIRRSGLRDARAGFGLGASWPTQLLPFRIPIDHCFASDALRVVDHRVGPAVGSDHFPMIVDLALP